MRQYLDMTEAIDKLAGAHGDFVDYAREQSKALTIDIDSLLTQGWYGEAADTFSDFYTRMDTAHINMADGVEKWHEAVRSCSRPAGRAAILDGCNAILRGFEGNPVSSIVGILEYEDAVVDNMTTASFNFFQDMNDMCDRLDSVNRKANSLNYSYSSIRITDLSNKISEYGEGNLTFSNGYVQATNTYSEYINKLYPALHEAVGELDTTYKGLEKVKPTIPTQDPTSPAYRALAFSELLVSLPAADRAAIEKLAYDAEEPYRTIFFAYIDKVKINSLDGLFGSSMSIPEVGIYIDISDTTTILVNGEWIPRWYATLFHEIGHTIDYATVGSNGPALDEAMKKDVRDKLDSIGQSISNDPDEIKKAIDNIMKGKKLDKKPTDPSKLLQWEIQERMKTELAPNGNTPYNLSGVSDVYGGVTKNAVVGKWGHFSFGYWQVIHPSLEMFAENFSDGMLNYTDKRQNQEMFLPEASKLLNGDSNDPNNNGMMGDIFDEAQNRMGR